MSNSDSESNADEITTIPFSTDDTNLSGACMDLRTGIDILIDRLNTFGAAIINSESDTELMDDYNDVVWIVLRLKNDIKDINHRVDALPNSLFSPGGAASAPLAQAAE